MAKYDPLSTFLRRQKGAVVELSFRDIERVVGGMLPKAALEPKWWTLGDTGRAQPQKLAWSRVGYTAVPDIKREVVTFAPSASPACHGEDIPPPLDIPSFNR